MSNLKKNVENEQLVYCNLNNKFIIKCICLTKLFILDNDENKDFNEMFAYFNCNKVKIITIYDIDKNIISKPIQIDLFKKPIKIGEILENLERKNIYFFKTFIGSIIKNNKINNIKYCMYYCGVLSSILYNNIKVLYSNDYKEIIINDNKGNHIYNICIYNDKHRIYKYYKYKNSTITIVIYNNYIKIIQIEKLLRQFIYINKKNFKIYKIEENYDTTTYKEKRNNNNEITILKKYSEIKKLENFFFDSNNPPFSKPLKDFCIRLIYHYNMYIKYFIELTEQIFKIEKKAHYNLLLKNLSLEMIDFNLKIINSNIKIANLKMINSYSKIIYSNLEMVDSNSKMI